MKKNGGYWAILAAICIVVVASYAITTHESFLRPTQSPKPASLTAGVGTSHSKPPVVAVTPPAPAPQLAQYIEIMGGCNWAYVGTCVKARSGPGTDYPIVSNLRTGMVLAIANATTTDGQQWYEVQFDSEVRYPERITSDWYVAADPTSVRLFEDPGVEDLTRGEDVSTKKVIVVDLSKEMLYAYDDGTLYMQDPISTGLELTPTPKGVFTIYRKTPTRYMQGPIPGVSDQSYDLPGVPWDLYFTNDGAVIHGAYWHNHFGQPWSHGCVNLSPQEAKRLYEWAVVGMPVIVQ
ncbi:MAG: L,D-transpeptidase family protein [Candidatus Pacebacteria bacterium]|nr:L,D-transpeptidase family protein [Candidatus Paceibacterota bacterium]